MITIPNPNRIVPGGPWKLNPKGRPGSYLGPKGPNGGRAICQYVPPEIYGGPNGAKKPYWKVNQPGTKGWQRYNLKGQLISPGQAHPKPNTSIPKTPWLLFFTPTDLH